MDGSIQCKNYYWRLLWVGGWDIHSLSYTGVGPRHPQVYIPVDGGNYDDNSGDVGDLMITMAALLSHLPFACCRPHFLLITVWLYACSARPIPWWQGFICDQPGVAYLHTSGLEHHGRPSRGSLLAIIGYVPPSGDLVLIVPRAIRNAWVGWLCVCYLCNCVFVVILITVSQLFTKLFLKLLLDMFYSY